MVPHVVNPDVTFFAGRDGVRLAYREVGAGRPLVLLHGISNARNLWIGAGRNAEGEASPLTWTPGDWDARSQRK
ncbi:hypothetical protein SAMN05216499_13043 [Actinacidiphila paucisporea]|uniref:Uncharacterized protein n=1 Tax=Actinacidiphila paucisporea TaxID=310782 RepID=A0A1M7Q807_9ACTN|nr:hypothetical protein SAMN05216499_13043 [Actinacidiphila paucisporea]